MHKDGPPARGILETGAIDYSIGLEAPPVLVKYACLVEFSWGLVATTVNWLTSPFLDEEPVPEPPKPLTAVCGWIAFGKGGDE